MNDNKSRVLIIDNDIWFADILKQNLSDFEVDIVKDLDKVFPIIESNSPDLILADTVLGSKNLFMFLHEMQSYVDTRVIPVVILSIHAKRINLADIYSLGVRGVLDKSTVVPEALNKEVSRIINQVRDES